MRLARFDSQAETEWIVTVNGKEISRWLEADTEKGLVIFAVDASDSEAMRLSGYTDPVTGEKTVTLFGDVKISRKEKSEAAPSGFTTDGAGNRIYTKRFLEGLHDGEWILRGIEWIPLPLPQKEADRWDGKRMTILQKNVSGSKKVIERRGIFDSRDQHLLDSVAHELN